MVFGSPNTRIINSTFVQSVPNAGNGVSYKHLGGLTVAQVGTFEVSNCQFYGGSEISVGISAPNSRVFNNLFVDAGEIRVKDQGGTAQLANIVIEKNTFVTTKNRQNSAAISYFPAEYNGLPLGTVLFANNLIADQRLYSHGEQNTINLDQYGSNDFYNRSIARGLFQSRNNVYTTRDNPRFDVFGVNNTPDRSLGSVFNFAQWNSQPYVRDEFFSTLGIDANYQNADATARGAGRNSVALPALAIGDAQIVEGNSGTRPASVPSHALSSFYVNGNYELPGGFGLGHRWARLSFSQRNTCYHSRFHTRLHQCHNSR